MTDQLNQDIIEDLLKLKDDGNLYHRESQCLEFKESFNLAGLADYSSQDHIRVGSKESPNE